MANWRKIERNLAIGGFVASALVCVAVEHANAPTHKIQPSYVTQRAILGQKADANCHHAVICGGIHGLQDIARSQQTWPNFDVGSSKHFRLPYGIWGYVTYRDNEGRIHVSSIRREIPKDTEVYEDAFGHIILARCGNEFTDSISVGTVERTQPGPSDVFPEIQGESGSFAIGETDIPARPAPYPQTPTDPTPSGPSQPPSYPTCCGGIQPRTPISVAEPSELIQCAVGLSSLLAFFLFVRNRFRF